MYKLNFAEILSIFDSESQVKVKYSNNRFLGHIVQFLLGCSDGDRNRSLHHGEIKLSSRKLELRVTGVSINGSIGIGFL